MKLETITQAIRIIHEQNGADGCRHCAYAGFDEWQMPCSKCKRNAKDYWKYDGEVE